MALASIPDGGTKPRSNPVCTPRFRYDRYGFWGLTDLTGGSTLSPHAHPKVGATLVVARSQKAPLKRLNVVPP